MSGSPKVAIITGGASGMGLAGVELLVKLGWNVTIFDFSKAGAQVATTLGKSVLFVRGNAMLYDDQVEVFKQTWDKWGRLDLVWANAGFSDAQDFSKPAVELANGAPPRPNTHTVDVCLTGVIYTSYLALHYFRKAPKNHGRLILQASVNGLWGNARLILYSAAKHGVIGLTRALSERLRDAGENISVNTICPGLVATPAISTTLTENIPTNMMTPMSTIMAAFEKIIFDDSNKTGQILEASGLDVIPKDPLPYGNQATEYIVELRYRGVIDTSILAQHAEQRAKIRKEMEIIQA